jgi:pimeloyl-ACP methyl ester carboxylesterase
MLIFSTLVTLLRYPNRVNRLYLASPIGIAPAFDRSKSKDSIIEKIWIAAGEYFYNLRITLNRVLRLVGPFGKILVRMHAMWRFHDGLPLAEYTYRVNSQKPTIISNKTEESIWELLLPGAFAKKSLVDRMSNYKIDQIKEFSQKTLFIYGDHDWMDSTEPVRLRDRVEEICHENYLNFFRTEFIAGGHQLHWDNPIGFSNIIKAM